MWVDGKVMLNARYFALHNGLPGLPLGLIFADANSAENKGYLIKPSNSKQYLCKLHVLIDGAQILVLEFESPVATGLFPFLPVTDNCRSSCLSNFCMTGRASTTTSNKPQTTNRALSSSTTSLSNIKTVCTY